MNTRNNTYKLLIHAILPIMLGGLVYMLFRSTKLEMFHWANTLGFRDFLMNIRGRLINIHLPDWCLYSLPDGLWVYAFASTLIFIWKDDQRKLFLFLTIPLLLGPGVELLQLIELFKGTFDVMDLIITSMAFMLSIFFNLKINKYENQVC